MITDDQLSVYPNIQFLLNFVKKHYFIYNKTYKYILENFDNKYLDFSEKILNILKKIRPDEKEYKDSILSFIKFSHEYLILQGQLNRDGKYLYSTFDEVNENVYQDNKMGDYYLDGLMLSQVLWPNHYKMLQYFMEQNNSTNDTSIILEVPSGTGIYSFLAANNFKFSELHAVDISPFSKAYTEKLLDHLRDGRSKISTILKSVFELDNFNTYDFIISGELLEHLEDPGEFLDRLGRLMKQGGKLFLTTAIWAANIDHIYLFRNVEEVRDMLLKYFSTIESELILPATLKEFTPDMERIPINYACVLKEYKG